MQPLFWQPDRWHKGGRHQLRPRVLCVPGLPAGGRGLQSAGRPLAQACGAGCCVSSATPVAARDAAHHEPRTRCTAAQATHALRRPPVRTPPARRAAAPSTASERPWAVTLRHCPPLGTPARRGPARQETVNPCARLLAHLTTATTAQLLPTRPRRTSSSPSNVRCIEILALDSSRTAVRACSAHTHHLCDTARRAAPARSAATTACKPGKTGPASGLAHHPSVTPRSLC